MIFIPSQRHPKLWNQPSHKERTKLYAAYGWQWEVGHIFVRPRVSTSRIMPSMKGKRGKSNTREFVLEKDSVDILYYMDGVPRIVLVRQTPYICRLGKSGVFTPGEELASLDR